MTFQEYLNSLIAPITSFISWLGLTFNYLITNYLFITFLGLTIITSLLFYFIGIVNYHITSCSKDLDNINRKGE